MATHRTLGALALAGLAACASERASPLVETVYTITPPTWFEDGWSHYRVSLDARRALFGARFGDRLLDLERGVTDTAGLAGGLDQVHLLTFGDTGKLVRRGVLGPDTAWYAEGPGAPERLTIRADVWPAWSPDGRNVAWYRPGESELAMGPIDAPRRYALDRRITGISWSPDGEAVFALAFEADGSSTLIRVRLGADSAEVLMRGLDAPSRFNSIAVAPDGSRVYLALASDTVPDNEARHRPDADRDTDIYRLDIGSRQLRVVVEGAGDDFHPQIVGGRLYWTHNEMLDDVIVVPASGGEPRVVAPGAEIPSWSPDGRRLAYTFGGWRIADWALNLDAAAVDVDSNAMPVSAPQPIVTGYHEDFTPAWSPDGRWIVYHSHRSAGPVADYGAPGASDDLYLRRPDAPMAEELRLTDFGWEVGVADWSPDGRRLVFDSWERGGAPGLSKPWIATIDPGTGRPSTIRRLPIPAEVPGTLFLSWSPRRDQIAFIAEGEGTRQALWVIGPDGRDARRVAEFESSTYGGVDWTPDGERLVYAALADGRMQLFEIPLRGGTPRQLTQDPHSLLHPQVSPDGRWIAATRIRRSMALRRSQLPTDNATAR